MTGPTRKKRDPLGGQPVDGDVADALRRRRGGGEPLPAQLGEQLGGHLGTDLSGIRVHADPQAGALAQSLQASAFTSGNDLYFAPGSYRPGSAEGMHTLAHELGHVVQQRTGMDIGSGPLRVGTADDPMEAHADRIAERTLNALRTGERPSATSEVTPARSAPGAIRRQWNDETVFTVIRELLPQLRQDLATVKQIEDPWKRSAAAAAFVRKAKGHATEGHSSASFRLSRTLDSAISATEALDLLVTDAEACLCAADLAVIVRREQIDRQVASFEAEQREVQTIADRLTELARELTVPVTRPSAVSRAVGEAEESVGSTLNPSDSHLEGLNALVAKERLAYDAELRRLLAAKPVIEAFVAAKFEAEDILARIRELLEGTTWKSRTTGPLAEKAAQDITDALKGTRDARNLLTRDPLGTLQQATKTLTSIAAAMSSGKDGSLGVLAQEARESADRAGTTTKKTQRTSLPALKASEAPAVRAQMLIDAVKESAKSPAWKQVAIDFTLNRLALGRPDHIHICGGGNTLIYRDRLIRGYMTQHLDSRTESKAQFGRILYRDTDNPVNVTVKSGILYEVIPG